MAFYMKTSTTSFPVWWRKRGYTNKKNKSGFYPDSYCFFEKRTMSNPDVDHSLTWGQPGDTPGADVAYKKAYGVLLSKIQDRSDMMANCFELGSTVGTVSKALATTCKATSSIVKGIHMTKRGNFYGAKKYFRQAIDTMGAGDLKKFNDTAAGAILAVNWGLVPVFDDVTKMLNQRMAESLVNGKRVHAAAQGPQFKSVVDFNDGVNKWFRTADIFCRMSCTVRLSNPSLYQAARTGITNPLATAWELCPFSFVVDWFCNVGDILSGLTDLQGVELSNGSYSYKMVSNTNTFFYGGSCTTEYMLYERFPSVPSPPPVKLEFSSPFTGLKRLLNQVAFLVTQSKSLRN